MLKRDEAKISELMNTVKADSIQFVKLWFVDILGNLKSFTITAREFEHALCEGMGFDGSSVEGFARIYESDLLAMPDLNTFRIMPWKFSGMPVAHMFCDILTPEGEPYAGDTRHVLRRNLEEMRRLGFSEFMVGPELEYFYFRGDSNPEPLDNGGYFDSVPLDDSADLRRETMVMLEQLGIASEYAHHEVAPSQHEIDLRYDEALKMADKVITYRAVVKQVASNHGCYATFMPKPLNGVNGSGMHVHQSLFKDGRNTFFNASDPDYLSDDAKHFMAGILAHVREICAVTNQWVNSYKRLIPGFEAPVYIAWAKRNRSALVRLPQSRLGKSESTRVESRFPDPGCNPYLAFSVLLAAGLDGIKRKLPLAAPVEADIYSMGEIERRANKIDTLPGSLKEAIELASSSALLKETLGEHVFEKFIENKIIEWDEYRTHVTDFEVKKYLSSL